MKAIFPLNDLPTTLNPICSILKYQNSFRVYLLEHAYDTYIRSNFLIEKLKAITR